MAEKLSPKFYQNALEIMKAKAVHSGLKPADIAGVSLGGCVSAIGTERKGAFRHKAHAHDHPKDEFRNWICFLSAKPENLLTSCGNPSLIFAHEYAHLLAPGGHHDKWRVAISILGHRAEAAKYRKRIAVAD